jgi:hypothetical protein
LSAHNLIRKPEPIPDHVGDKLYRIMRRAAYAARIIAAQNQGSTATSTVQSLDNGAFGAAWVRL